ncbi:MAG: hypothetical protein KC493_07480 [Bacteriovoracaceae bacterium]|nr:hypothetical protein [Bacteriovoracaceae bacterium]
MKFILLILILITVGCGKGKVVVTLANPGNSGTHYQEPNELTIDIQTITDEVEIVNTNPSSTFIKDFSKVHVLPSINTNNYLQVGNILYLVNFIEKLHVKLEGGKIVQDLSAQDSSATLSYSSFQMRALDLATNKIIYNKVFDNHFNENSFLPTKNGEYWNVKNLNINSQVPVFLYRKMQLVTNCHGSKPVCTKPTDEHAIATLNPSTGVMKFVTSMNSNIARVNYYNNSIYFNQIVGNNLIVNRLNTLDQMTTKQSIPLHSNKRDQINRDYFLKDSFYISGRWSKEPKKYSLELMKLDLDLTVNPTIAFDNSTSGPGGNIDVIDDGKYHTSIKRLNSMNDSILIISSEFDMGDSKRYYDTYLIDSTSGELVTYFNKKAPLRREYSKNEIFYNDDNHIYFLKHNKESLFIESVNKGGVTTLINKALSAKIDFKRTFVSPVITFFEIHNGVATILIYDQGNHHLKRFNIH